MTEEVVTITEYARQRGITHDAVRKAITAGRLKECLVQNEKGRLRLLPDVADREWQENTQHHRRPGPQPVAGGIFEPAADNDDLLDVPNFNVSRAKREAYQAELARLEYEEKQGTLVNAEAVKKEAFRTARLVRDAMLNIADRIAAELAADTDSFSVHRKLTDEIRTALSGALGDEE